MKTLFQYLAAAFLFVAAYDANAQYGFTSYSGMVTFHKSVTDQCPLLAQGDQAPITIFIPTGDFGFLYRHKVDMGAFGFATTTSSGVPVQGVGDLVADFRSGTFYITQITIGDPAGDFCDLAGLNLGVKVTSP